MAVASRIRIMLVLLLQRLDRFRRSSRLSELPVSSQLLAVQDRPFQNEGERAPRKSAAIYAHGVNLDEGLVVPVSRVKVGREMVVVEDADHNAEEPADLGHRAILTRF